MKSKMEEEGGRIRNKEEKMRKREGTEGKEKKKRRNCSSL